MINEHHISSLVIQSSPAHIETLEQELQTFGNIEINVSDTLCAKIIAVLETKTSKDINQTIEQLNDLPGVISVAMVYHHCEPIQSLNEALA